MGAKARPTGNAAQRQARAAAMRAAQAKQDRQRRAMWISAAAVAVIVVVLAALVIVKVSGGGSKNTATAGATGPASAAVVAGVTKVPPATLAKVGAGSVSVLPQRLDSPPLTADGKPRVLYIGAEYCPYCAAERWGMVVALSRFGTWSGLQTTSSSASDVDPSTPTLSFHGASFTSDYLSFTGVEETTNVPDGSNGYKPLDTPAPADAALLAKYDAPPYVSSSSAGAIPFVDFGGRYLISGASYDPKLLAGKTHEQVAGALADPDSPVAKAVDGTANTITASLCNLTKQKPANVCGNSAITELGVKIDAQH